MDLKKFKRIFFPRPSTHKSSRFIDRLIGLDSETLKDGRPFMFALGDGTSFDSRDVPAVFFRRAYRDKDFCCYNLKFDSGSLVYTLPLKVLSKRRVEGKATYKGYRYRYIPHKRLGISKGKHSVSIWDVAQYFRTTLDKAAKQFLGEGKLDFETKSFTMDFVRKNFTRLKEYCIRDANLAGRLGDYLLKFLADFGIKPNNLYSEASISFEYFKRRAGIVDVHRFWRFDREAMKFAFRAYSGGKFEVTARGAFEGYEYDAHSCYPAEIANLVDISQAKARYYCEYIPDAQYSYLYIEVEMLKDFPHSLAVKRHGVNTYPIGCFRTYATKNEYEYLRDNGIKVRIIDGWHLFVKDIRYPYREVVHDLFRLKQSCPDKKSMKALVAKYLLNGFYGKMGQLIKMLDGSLRAGPGFNPFYFAEITANARLQICRLQQELGKRCLATHTDSVLSTVPIPRRYVGKGLGQFGLTKKGKGIIIACGMYQIADKSAERGFILRDGLSWKKILQDVGNATTAKLKERRTQSWLHAAYRQRPDTINVFRIIPKTLDLNCDSKRLWPSTTTGKKLLSRLEYSSPHVLVSS